MFKNAVVKKFSIILVMVVIIAAMPAMKALAATSYGPGEHYLGHFTFQDANTGAKRTYNAKQMRIKIAWKKGEWEPWASDINMRIRVYRAYNGKNAFSKTFTPKDDTDGRKDGSGYYYAVSGWFTINKGSDYRIEYDASTVAGAKGTGHYRKGDVHTWIELR